MRSAPSTPAPDRLPATPDVLYEAWRRRDPSLDGKVFIGVRTTGIYCRSVCPAKTPLKKNVAFYATPQSAERAGFRPCKRCRPDTRPGSAAWSGSSTTVTRALRLIASNWANEHGLPALAQKLGIGERQLRRLFVEHLGKPPREVLAEHRLRKALKLLQETQRPIADIALDSGFESLRRFNSAFKSRYGHPPSHARTPRRIS